MPNNFNKWDLPAAEPKHKDPERYGTNHPRNKKALELYEKRQERKAEQEYWG
jgi:hypothetical protein